MRSFRDMQGAVHALMRQVGRAECDRHIANHMFEDGVSGWLPKIWDAPGDVKQQLVIAGDGKSVHADCVYGLGQGGESGFCPAGRRSRSLAPQTDAVYEQSASAA